jgi:hypothetical protein
MISRFSVEVFLIIEGVVHFYSCHLSGVVCIGAYYSSLHLISLS